MFRKNFIYIEESRKGFFNVMLRNYFSNGSALEEKKIANTGRKVLAKKLFNAGYVPRHSQKFGLVLFRKKGDKSYFLLASDDASKKFIEDYAREYNSQA